MAYSPYFIGNFRAGLEKDMDSYLLPEDAYQALFNAYLWRGRIYKKGGNTQIGRLGVRSIVLGTRGAGADTYNVTLPEAPIEPGALAPYTLTITDGTTTFVDNGTGGFVVTPGANGTVNAPTNYATGAINITFNVGNAGQPVKATYILKVSANSPVMGFLNPEGNGINESQLLAFDLTSAYLYNNATTQFNQTRFYKTAPAQTTSNVVNWHGTNTNFFQGVSYQAATFATNNVPGSNFLAITAITQAAAAVITVGATAGLGINAGDYVYINNVVGMTQINNLTGVISAVGANTITVNINSAGFGAYTSGGVVWFPTLNLTGHGDGIRWYDGTGWVNFAPPLNVSGGTVPNTDTLGIPYILQGCLLMFAYRDRLVCLNTWEGLSNGVALNYPQRARWSQNGTVYYEPPLPQNTTQVSQQDAWYTQPNKGGFIDCPTGEAIISAEFIKDCLVVFFENSTYRLVYTGNPVLPFIWERVNTEIGADSTNSIIPFDRELLTVGVNGIYACDSVNIDRIDRLIPSQVFEFENNTGGPERVFGIRDFYSEFAYWSYVDKNAQQNYTSTYPNRCLVYNYVDKSWGIFVTSYTSFGHYYNPIDATWGNLSGTWGSNSRTWGSALNDQGSPEVVAGNQQGFVFILSQTAGNESFTNDKSLVIQNITTAVPAVFTSINHNFELNNGVGGANISVVQVNDVNGTTGLNGNCYIVAPIDANTFNLLNQNGVPVSITSYNFGGTLKVLDIVTIGTKNINPYAQLGHSTRVGYIDLFLENTVNGQIDAVIITDDSNGIDAANVSQVLLTNPNDPTVAMTTKFWTRVFFQTQDTYISLLIAYDGAQVTNYAVMTSPLVIHGMVVWLKPTGRLLS